LNATSGRPTSLAPSGPCIDLATHPDRSEILVGTSDGRVLLCSVAGRSCRTLPGRFGWEAASPVAFDVEGRRAVAGPYGHGRGIADPKDRVIRIWALESGAEQTLSVAHLTDADWDSPGNLGFAYDGSLIASLGKGGRVMRLTLPDDRNGEITAETVVSAASAWPTLSRDGRLLLVHASENPGSHNFQFEQLLLFDLVEGTSRRITSHGSRLFAVSQIDPTERILVTGDLDGIVRVGPITGEAPHLLLGHTGGITSLAISPDSRWIASAGDTSVRLWPMPDVTRPPLHTLPRAELLAKLDELTNLRAVRDPESSTGWTLEVGPFPGWETVPTW
jgi:WD40 repeat protein